MLAEIRQQHEEDGIAALHVAGAAAGHPVARREVFAHGIGQVGFREELFEQFVRVVRPRLERAEILRADRIDMAVPDERLARACPRFLRAMHIGKDIFAPKPVAWDFLCERPLRMRRKIRKRAQPAENELRDFALPCRSIDAADADEILRQGFHFLGKINARVHHAAPPSTAVSFFAARFLTGFPAKKSRMFCTARAASS